MRHIGNLDNREQADAFASYLLVKGIQTQVDWENGQADIWVRDEDQFQQALDELKTFQQNPDDPRYAESQNTARKIVKQEQQRKKEIQKRIVKVGERDFRPKPFVTLALIGISLVIALLTDFGASRPDGAVYQATQFTVITPPESLQLQVSSEDDLRLRFYSILHGEVWRLATPMFIHYGVIHILFNAYMLFGFGAPLERRYGWWRMLLLVLGTGVIANVAQAAAPMAWDGSIPFLVGEIRITTFGGLSGVVYGLFGFIWLKAAFDPESRLMIPESTVVILMAWFVGCIFAVPIRDTLGFSIFPVHVANWAHGGGLVSGMLFGYLSTFFKPR